MKIREQTIQMMNELSAKELMLVNEWINQLIESHHTLVQPVDYKITYAQLHAASRRCKTNFSEEILKQREERL